MKISTFFILLMMLPKSRLFLSVCEDSTTLTEGLLIERTNQCIQCSKSSNLVSNEHQSQCTCDAYSGFDLNSKTCQSCSDDSISFFGICESCKMVVHFLFSKENTNLKIGGFGIPKEMRRLFSEIQPIPKSIYGTKLQIIDLLGSNLLSMLSQCVSVDINV